jgi:hypothetical protein
MIAKDTPAPKRIVEQLKTVGLVVKTTESPGIDLMKIRNLKLVLEHTCRTEETQKKHLSKKQMSPVW